MITILGGSGFIGSRLCENLSKRNMPFEIIDIKVSRNFPEKTKIVDIRDYKSLSVAITGDIIINLAAVHRDDVQDVSEYYTTNVGGVENVCKIADEKNITKIVFTSTVAVYGFSAPNTPETGIVNPFNHYGKSKFQGEEVLRSWYNRSPNVKSLVIIRPTVVFGEGNRGNVYNLLNHIQSGKFVMVGSGKNKKSMAYVGNIANFLEAASAAECGYHLVNYVDGPDFDMNTLVRRVRLRLKGKNSVGFRIPYVIGLGLGYVADVTSFLANRNLPISSIRVKKFCKTTTFYSSKHKMNNFAPQYSLQEGLDRTLESEFISPVKDREIFYTE